MNSMTIESMLITIKTQREYLIESTLDKIKLLREIERLTAELVYNSVSLEKIRKNHHKDLLKNMEINIKLENRINDVTKQNQALIDENEKISKELSVEKRKHAETTYYYEGRYYDGKCVCIKDEYVCPHCRIEGTDTKEPNNEIKQEDIVIVCNRIDDDDDVDEHNDDDDKTNNDSINEYINTIEIDNNTSTQYDIHDETLPLIERIDRCLNNNSSENETNDSELSLCYDNTFIGDYNHKKHDDNDEEFDYFMSNSKNVYIDNYFSNRL
uniref:Uncharacterized protein n=1 Tax=viral metagenome TaxID=1070528 RepID=A0A6C0E9V5_9ZZZZ